MTKLGTLFFSLFFVLSLQAQKVPLSLITQKIKSGQKITAKDFGFKEYKIFSKGDTIAFYTYQKTNLTPTSIYVSLPGSAAENIYSYHKDKDSSYWYNSLTTFDFSYLPDNYLFVIVAKPGFDFCGNGDSIIPEKYWDKTSLEDRVMRANVAINYIRKNIVKNAKETVVFGYSEGFYVAAKLATINKTITHLGIGGGGGYNDFYDFLLFNQKSVLKNEMNADTAIKNNQKIISTLHQITLDSASTNFVYGYTYKRWASFSEPAIQNLVKLNIPIYQVHGYNDESTPVEDAYIVPLEFARLHKSNLTFKIYPNCDHSLIEHTKEGNEINHWDEMMKEFFNWVSLH
jgi:pimeloyl-ACP methyl ester carboxylesterase